MSSFYDLWNTCFPEPEDFQAKKKLSKFDKKNQNKIIKKKADLEFDQNSSLRSSQTYLNNSSYHSTNSESQTQQIITNLRTQIIDNSYQNQLQQQESLYISQSTDNSSQKKVINNRIFEEESYEEEPMNNYHQYNNYTNLYQQEVQHFNQFSCETSHYEQKQFVCLLILKYFEIYEQQEIPSFYELWNICHPQEIQKKKKLTKYDKQAEQNTKVKQEACNNNEQFNSSSLNTLKSSCSLSQTIQFDQLKQEISSNTNLEIDNFNQSYENTNINLQFSDYQDHKPHKQPINNGIFEEDSYEEESMSHFQQQNKPIYYQDQVLFITQNDFLDYRQEFQRDHY
ncbi:hypothetical protein ABPG74_019157 [Tetrahymena malaccensis]